MPCGPRLRRAISSATMLIAISGTDCEPISSPTGAATRSRSDVGDPRFAQALENEPDLAAAADQADVRRRGRRKLEEGFLVVAVPPRHDQGISLGSDFERGQHLFDRADQ